MTILDRIVKHKYTEIPRLKAKYGHHFIKREKISFIERIKNQAYIAIIAEIKRASPSKGLFAIDLNIKEQAKFYEKNGADCISVLVDEHFFCGSYDFISEIRSVTNLPILFKEFILSHYQIELASHLGADLILLIESILSLSQLEEYIEFAHKLGLEVLVEVDSIEALHRIKDLDFSLLGINNRNLKDFTINTEKTNQLKSLAKAYDKIVISESGVHSREDLLKIRGDIAGILIGEALVRKPDLLKELSMYKEEIKVKICGITDSETLRALDGKCHYIGLVFAKSRRQVSLEQAKEMRKHVQKSKLVGVFKNQSMEEIIHVKRQAHLDMVQVHNAFENSFPFDDVIFARNYDDLDSTLTGYLLIDGKTPGSGETYPLEDIQLRDHINYFLAGGLHVNNVESRLEKCPCFAVDVSSGVEINNKKSMVLIDEFIEKVRQL